MLLTYAAADMLCGGGDRCCGWPWVVPELRDLILAVLHRSEGAGLPLSRLYPEMRREQRRTTIPRNQRGCVRDCLDLQLPGPQQLGAVIYELASRGDVTVSEEAPPAAAAAPVEPRTVAAGAATINALRAFTAAAGATAAAANTKQKHPRRLPMQTMVRLRGATTS